MLGFSVYSKINDSFNSVMFFPNERSAVHSFLKFLKEVPFEDKELYSLYRVCSFNEENGIVNGCDYPVAIDVDAVSESIYGSVPDEEIE